MRYGIMPDTPEKIEIESIKRMDIRDGDVLVVKCHDALTEGRYTNIRTNVEALLAKMGVDCKLVILDNGMSMEVLRKDDEHEQLSGEGGKPDLGVDVGTKG